MAAELVGVDELRSNHDLCALHAGNADHLRVVNIDIDAQKDVADGGGDGFDFMILLQLRLVVQVAVGRSLDAQNLTLWREQAEIENVIDNKAAGDKVHLVLCSIFSAGVQIIGRIPFGDIRFNIGKDDQVGELPDLSEGGNDADYGTSHRNHLFEFDGSIKKDKHKKKYFASIILFNGK